MARRRTKSREIDPANRSAKHPCKTAIQLLPHGSTKRSIKRAIPHNAAGNSGMTGNTDIPRCCPFGSGSRASVSRVWRVAARAHRTHTTVIHSSNRTERISASPFRRTATITQSPPKTYDSNSPPIGDLCGSRCSSLLQTGTPFGAVNSSSIMSPVFLVSAGSKMRTSASLLAIVLCSIPRGTTNNSPSLSVIN